MRRLSDGVEAALHCVLVLTAVSKDKVLPGKSLAELHGLSETYLLKHLRNLTVAGIVEALPGPRGGYRLGREPQEISMLDIVSAIDGPGPAFVCREIRRKGPGKTKNACAYKQDCFIKTRMLAAEAVWREALQSQTLADLVEDGETMIEPANTQAVADFVEKSQR